MKTVRILQIHLASNTVNLKKVSINILSLAFRTADYAESLAISKLDQLIYLVAMNASKLIFVSLLFCTACGNKASDPPDLPFDKAKWNIKSDGHYSYRKQMVNDLLNNYKWTGIKKDSVTHLLGQPDDFDEGNLIYDYERKAVLGGLGTSIEAVVFELAPDSTVITARLNDGGWD